MIHPTAMAEHDPLLHALQPVEASCAPEVGKGTYGRVKEDMVNGERRAVKVFYAELLTPGAVERLFAEISKLNFTGLLPPVSVAVKPSPSLAMALIPRCLQVALREGLGRRQRTGVLLDVARALQYMHTRRPPLYHGDVHSRNVLLTSDGRGRLTDYAQVHMIGRNPVEAVRLRGAGHRCLLYMPPEAFTQPPSPAGSKFDVFSFGVVMLETLCEPQPWKVGVSSAVEYRWPEDGTQRRTVMAAIPLTHPLRSVAEQCLSRKCGDRPKVSRLILELERVEEQERVDGEGGEEERRGCDHVAGPSMEGGGRQKGEKEEEVQEKEEKEEEEDEGVENCKEQKSDAKKKKAEDRVQGVKEGVKEEGWQEGASVEENRREKDKELEKHTSFATTAQSHVTSSPSHLIPASGHVTTDLSRVTTVPDRPTSLFEQGSMVEVKGIGFGVVQWMGRLQGKTMAGVELEDFKPGCSNGTIPGSAKRLFSCPTGHGIFSPVSSLSSDWRFEAPQAVNPLSDVPLDVVRERVSIPPSHLYCSTSEPRGVQGEHNSCYLDAAVFGLFATSNEFDLVQQAEEEEEEGEGGVVRSIRDILWTKIINPLRKNGIVRCEPVLELRGMMEQLGRMKGLRQEEKDPEEFLNVLFKHALHLPPFITIQRPQGEEGEFFVQLFLEQDESLRQPTIRDLLYKTLTDQNITFSKVPSKLLVLVPRYGKQFKLFERITPDLQINITDLCTQSALQHYPNLRGPSNNEGRGGEGGEGGRGGGGRGGGGGEGGGEGRTGRVKGGGGIVGVQAKLQLLSVVCIATSHYVCFTRSNNRWLFMDSMSDRVDDAYNIPKCVDCTEELMSWVYGTRKREGGKMAAKELPELARRFTLDVYMCVYIEDSTFV